MLDRTLLPKKFQHPWTVKHLNRLFETSVDMLSAEYILLNRSETLDEKTFLQDLEKTYFPQIPFTADCVSGMFADRCRIVNHDTKKASAVLMESLVDTWCLPNEDQFEKPEVDAFKQYFFDNYFSKLHEIEPCEKATALFARSMRSPKGAINGQREVVYGIIAEYLECGDNVLYALCPISRDPKQTYRITLSGCPPFFKRLVEKRGNDIIIVNADTKSADFLLAFMEMCVFESDTHKKEFLARLATMLMQEGKLK